MLTIKNIGNVDTLKGMFMEEIRSGKLRTLKDIPVELLTIDTTYQTPVRTKRDMGYLVNNWSERKLLPLVVVPHFETGLCYVVDGWGRANASQIIDSRNEVKRYECLCCLVLLDAPEDATERRKFEAEEYAFQNRNVAKMRAIHKHGAMEVLGNAAVLKLDEMQKKYGFNYVSTQGYRGGGVLGSYTDALNLCKESMEDCAEYVFDLCRDTGFANMANGYSRYVFRAFRDAWRLYPEYRNGTKKYLVSFLRGTTPQQMKADAVHKYPKLDLTAACSLYLEDILIEHFAFDRIREEKNGKVVFVNKESA